MYCPNCRAALMAGSRFCNACGAAIGAGPAQPTQTHYGQPASQPQAQYAQAAGSTQAYPGYADRTQQFAPPPAAAAAMTRKKKPILLLSVILVALLAAVAVG